MKTLTITEAKKNLSRLLQSAARGDDIGIVSGADIIALRKVGIHSDDYAWQEYGVTPEHLEAFDQAAEKRYHALKKAGKLIELTPAKLKKLIEKETRH